MRFRLPLSLALGVGAYLCCGCQPRDDLPKEPVLQPVRGKVTVEGKPLGGAVVTFLQADETGTTAVGETDEEGAFEVSYLGRPGAAAAPYKVAISYLQGADGKVYGLEPRSGLAKPYGMVTAKERLEPRWSDLGQTSLRAKVSVGGGDFVFDLPEPLLPPLPPESKGDKTPAAPPKDGQPGPLPVAQAKEKKEAASPASPTLEKGPEPARPPGPK
jgi:hypothetical protein